MKKICVAIVAACALANAVTIKEIRYDGLSRISPTVAGDMLGFGVGDQIDIEKVNKSILKFFEQGYFEDIWIEEDSGALIFHFKEKPSISKIDFAGYSETEKEKMMVDLGIKKGDTLDDEAVEKAKKKIIKDIEKDGYFNTDVEVDKQPTKEGSVELSFIINKGEKVYIEELVTAGAKALSQDKILSQSANKQREFFGWLWGRNDGKLRLEELEYDSKRIQDVYLQNGYLDATVSPGLLKVDFNSYTASLFYKIFEGYPYKTKNIKFFQKKEVIEPIKLGEGLKLKGDETFNVELMRKDMEKIRTKVADLGYAFTKVYPDFQKSDENKTVDIVYTIDAGEKVYINDVLISGNARTTDSVIRRDVFMAPGDLYSLTDLTDSKNALKRTGFFEDITVDEKRISADKMDIVIKAKEAPTGNVMVGGGYGSYDGLLVNAGISDKNLFGSGINTTFSVDLSKKQTNFDFSIYNPRAFDSKYSFGFDMFDTKYIAYDYTEKRVGAGISTGKQLTRTLYAGLGYQYAKINYSDFNTTVYYDLENTIKSAITPYLTYDTTDDFFLPRKGMTASTSLEYAGIGGEEKYAKSFSKFAYFYGLEDLTTYDIILRYKARMGYIFDDTRVTRGAKFFMGGLSSVRGFQSNSIAQKDMAGNILGDTKTFSNSLEANFPLVDAAKVRYTLFYDYGMIGTKKLNDHVRSGFGAALEWFSPLGPLQLIFAHPVSPKPGDKTSNFEFTVGTRF